MIRLGLEDDKALPVYHEMFRVFYRMTQLDAFKQDHKQFGHRTYIPDYSFSIDMMCRIINSDLLIPIAQSDPQGPKEKKPINQRLKDIETKRHQTDIHSSNYTLYGKTRSQLKSRLDVMISDMKDVMDASLPQGRSVKEISPPTSG